MTGHEPAKHIFISYSHHDRDRVNDLMTAFQHAGLLVWIDQHSMSPGTPSWDQAVRDAIESAYLVILVASPSARVSLAVNGEISFARIKQRPILPIWVDGSEWADCVPLVMVNSHRLDLRGSSFDQNLAQLITIVSPTSSNKANEAALSLVASAQSFASITEYRSQADCERELVAACKVADRVKILTIRGERYFVGQKSLLKDICKDKTHARNSIRVLILSPDSNHITNPLAVTLGKPSAVVIRDKMRITRDYLAYEAQRHGKFEVKEYDTTPCFKLLMFDDILFVSSFIGPKNDMNAKMVSITRSGNFLFEGFERYFDVLWQRSGSTLPPPKRTRGRSQS